MDINFIVTGQEFKNWCHDENYLLISSLIDKGVQFFSSTLSMVPSIPIKPMFANYFKEQPLLANLSKSGDCYLRK
ncbi:unnamed protein product [Lactuca virosa]|uniref:Uncharacterized protein n=1 Tax=Lactuca virosa TaxID=75947 RepID=A0AAU9NAW8_9ASTR|nr:unnamed protein product [Lactuca virosa]